VLRCQFGNQHEDADSPTRTLRRPQQLSPAWTLAKGQRSAACTIWSHAFGFEVRLILSGDPLPRTQVCRTQEDLSALQETWRAALEAKDWAT
jgi:hypothetical protein